ncbi:MAG: DUF6456 domain-containing protein [Robiginitomaculum sp.]|nr:DUF6456 domain-containing protein [Robiginitomaculum sp.]
MNATEKRLFRILSKLIKHPQALIKDNAGGYNGNGAGGFVIKIPAAIVKYAIARGLLVINESGLEITDVTEQWLRRNNSVKDGTANSGESFAAQHWQLQEREVFSADGEFTAVRVNVEASPLLKMYRQRDKFGKRFLSDKEFAAGEKLRNDYACSNMGRISGSNWTGIARDKSVALSASRFADGNINAIDAKRRVMEALAWSGPMLDRVLFSVLLREQGLNSLEMDRHWPSRSAKIVLKIALARLALHYGL